MNESPLANPTYLRLYLAQIVALAGTGLTTVALALLAYDLAGGDASIVLGTALALKMIAYVGTAPVAGAFTRRIPRRTLLISLDIVRACIVICMPFITEVWQIYLLIFVLNTCSAAFTPTFQATIPDILPDDALYTRALSLSRLAYDLENLLSPLLAASLLLIMSYNVLFTINAFTFVISALLVFSVQLPLLKSVDDEQGIWSNITSGTRAYLATPRLRGLFTLSLAVSAAGAMVIVNTVVYVRDHLKGTESETALAFSAFGAGSMVVALALPQLLDRLPDRPFMLLGGILLSIGLFLGLFELDLIALLTIWTILGVGSSLIQTPAGRLLKRSANKNSMARIFAAQFALSHACWLVTYPLAGLLAAWISLDAAFLVLGALALCATALAALQWPGQDETELDHHHDEISHEHPHVHDEHHQHVHEPLEEDEQHSHPHTHSPIRHKHFFIIDLHHPRWPVE